MIDNDFFNNLTRKKLGCGKNLVELSTYNGLTLWWFVDSNFHHYIDDLQKEAANGKSSYLKFRLIFFYKKLEIFLDFLLMVTLKLILSFYGKNYKPLIKKNPRIIFTALNLEWRYVKDYNNRNMRKSDALFDSFIKEVKDHYEIIGTSPLDNSPFKSGKNLFERLSCWHILYKPFNLYWSINVWKREKNALNYFKRTWNIIEHDKVFKELCKYLEKDLSFDIKAKLHLYFYYWFPRAIKYIGIANEMVSQEKPDLFLIQDEIRGFGRALVITGKLLDVPTLAVQHGEFTVTDYGYIISKELKHTIKLPDITCVFGQHYSNLLVNDSIYEPEDLTITGSPRCDVFYELHKIYPKKQFLKKYRINANQKIILWTTQCHGISIEENIMNFESVFDTLQQFDNITLIIKQHPGEGEKFTKMIFKYLKEYKINVVLTPRTSDTYTQIYSCDILMTKHSTTAMEAIALNKPVIILNLSGKPDIVDYVKEGVALGVYRKQDLESAIKKLLTEDNELLKNRENFIQKFLYKIDGKATKRIVEIGNDLMNTSLIQKGNS